MLLPIKADSGWDYDYDSGSSWDYDSGSSWDTGSDWSQSSNYDSVSNSNYSGSSITIVDVITIFIVIVIIVYICLKSRKANSKVNNKNNINENNYNEVFIDTIKSVDPDLNIADFKAKAFKIYRDIQYAWSNFDTDTIRNLTTDELYNMYLSQLETLKLKMQQNIMSEIELEDIKIIGITNENNVINLSVYLKVKCYDYVIEQNTKNVVRGTDKKKAIIEYELSFIKSSVDHKTIEKCPNCGAPVDINASATCPYCDSILVKDSSTYVLSKKKTVGQRME